MKNLKIGLKKGDVGDDVNVLGEYLSGFSYLPKDSVGATFNDQVENAVSNLQQFYGFKVTGTVTPLVAKLLETKRCGNSDELEDPIKWSGPNITYAFENYPAVFSVEETTEVFRQAFLTWSNYCSLVFTELPLGSAADIVIKFAGFMHGCPTDFKGPGGELAHAFFPPPPMADQSVPWGQIHVDESESWSLNIPSHDSDLWTVALHEIGHALGLSHSSDPESVMHRAFDKIKRDLAQTDKIEIGNLYGSNIGLVVLNQQTDARPAFIFYNGLGYLVWKEGARIHLLKTKDFRVWFEHSVIPDIEDCASAPSVAVFDDKMYVTWQGTGKAIYLISSVDGVNWINRTQLQETTEQAPVICSAHNNLYLAWAETDRRVVVMRSADATAWTSRKSFDEDDDVDGPTLCYLKNKTYDRILLTWARKNQERMYLSAYNGLVWDAKIPLGTYTSSFAPGAVGANSCSVFSWIQDDHTLAICKTDDGRVFSPQMEGTETSSVAPGLGTMEGPIVQVWADDTAPHRIHIQTY